MPKKFLAVSIKGKEFIFDKRRMIAVPESSARKICAVLNDQRYKLKSENEVWHIHDNDYYFNSLIDMEIKRYSKRGMAVYRYYG